MDLESIPGVGAKTADALRELDAPAAALDGHDVAAIASAPGISQGRAARIVRAAIRAEHDDHDDFAATPRARGLHEEALELLKARTVTEYATARVETFYPSAARSRIEEVRTFAEEAMEREPTEAVREALLDVEPPGQPREVRVRDRCLATTDAETYAAAREAVPELSVELVDDARQLGDLARGYATVVALDETFAGIDLEGGVRVEPDALSDPVSIIPERTLSFFAHNREALEAAAAVHRASDLDPPVDLDALEAGLAKLSADGTVRGGAELDRLSTAIDDLDAAVSTAESVANDHLETALRERDVTIEGTDLLSLVERGAGVDSLLSRELADEYEAAIAQARNHLVDTLGLDDAESTARRAFPDEPTYPVEHDESVVSRLEADLTARRDRLAVRRKQRVAEELASLRDPCETLLTAALELDVELAIARFARDFECTMPALGDEGGVRIRGGRSPLLDVPFGAVEPVEYEIDGVSLLSGVNSGGKTSLLDLVGLVVTLAHMGLPVPADAARVGRIDELHYHAKSQGTLDAGAFESTIREFGALVTEVSADREVLVLVDELESITEPGASANIMAGILEALAERGATAVFVSHLARDIIEAAETDITVDGIQAHGLEDGELQVDRSPVRNTLARSTPELIVEKLAGDGEEERGAFYRSLLAKFEESEAGERNEETEQAEDTTDQSEL